MAAGHKVKHKAAMKTHLYILLFMCLLILSPVPVCLMLGTSMAMQHSSTSTVTAVICRWHQVLARRSGWLFKPSHHPTSSQAAGFVAWHTGPCLGRLTVAADAAAAAGDGLASAVPAACANHPHRLHLGAFQSASQPPIAVGLSSFQAASGPESAFAMHVFACKFGLRRTS